MTAYLGLSYLAFNLSCSTISYHWYNHQYHSKIDNLYLCILFKFGKSRRIIIIPQRNKGHLFLTVYSVYLIYGPTNFAFSVQSLFTFNWVIKMFPVIISFVTYSIVPK